MTFTATLAWLSIAGAEMAAPSLAAVPAVDGTVDTTEWGVASTYTFNSPRSGVSTLRVGYIAEDPVKKDRLALGLVLPDSTERLTGSDHALKDRVEVFVAPATIEGKPQSTDRYMTVRRDGSWEFSRGTGAGWSFAGAGGPTTATNTADWEFALRRSAASWEVEILVKIGAFPAGHPIMLGVRQTDIAAGVTSCDTATDCKNTSRPSGLKAMDPSKWERTTLTGRPSPVQFAVSPAKMEAAVGGDIIVNLPGDAAGGRLTVSVKEPGTTGYVPIPAGTRDPGAAGANRFYFPFPKVGSWSVQAVWAGDSRYAAITTAPVTIAVARPTPLGPTVLETGTLRVATAAEDAGAPAEWSYLNAAVRATDAAGAVLAVESLVDTRCRSGGWTGFANLGEGPIVLRFDPPVLRSALALSSLSGQFEANVKAYTSAGVLKAEINGQGTCSAPVFATLGDITDNIARIEISYSGAETAEIVDTLFIHPLPATPPAVVVRTSPAPLARGGLGEILVAAGLPTGVTRVQTNVFSGTTAIGFDECDAAPAAVWIDCPVAVRTPASGSRLTVSVSTTDASGRVWSATRTVELEADAAPPTGTLLSRPLLAAPGAAVAVTATARDASGVASIVVEAQHADGRGLANRTCTPATSESSPECVLSVTPPETGWATVTATLTDGAGNTRTIGPKPILVRGPDADGDGLPDAYEIEIGTSPKKADTDDDGLPDGWEVLGVDRNGDGAAELDLASLGADPQVRDIFMEVDWAVEGGHSHRPVVGALNLVRNVLASRGIRLHVDAAAEGGPFDPARFDHGHAAHRGLIDPARAGIFVHVVAGHMGGPAAGEGGDIYLPTAPSADQSAGRVGAQLLHEIGHLLELGHGGGGENTATARRGTTSSPRAAFTEDNKPNYLSVMNNAYAWGILVDTVDGLIRVPTYSGLVIGDLDESKLDEPAGIALDVGKLRASLAAGPAPIVDADAITGVRVRHACPDTGPVRWAFAPGPIDWNCNGGSSDAAVNADVNRGGDNAGVGTLVSRDDWATLSFRGASCPQYGFMLADGDDWPARTSDHGAAALGLGPCPLHPLAAATNDPLASRRRSVPVPDSPSEPIEDADGKDNDGDGLKDEGFADTDDDGVVNLIDGCPRLLDSTQSDRDRDGRNDACQAPPAAPARLAAAFDEEAAASTLTWDAVQGAWGYNVYVVRGGDVRRMGSTFPSTTATTMEIDGATGSDRYIVRAVGDAADQGPAAVVRPQTAEADGDGDDGAIEGTPALSGLVAALAAAGAALVARRRR